MLRLLSVEGKSKDTSSHSGAPPAVTVTHSRHRSPPALPEPPGMRGRGLLLLPFMGLPRRPD